MALSQIETASLSSALVAPTATALTTASGSAPSYSARAWVNFNGTGTVVIRASGNCSSVTDNGVGDYTINFSTAMVDANYSAVGSAGTGAVGNDEYATTTNFNQIPTISAVRIGTSRAASGTFADPSYVSVFIFR